MTTAVWAAPAGELPKARLYTAVPAGEALATVFVTTVAEVRSTAPLRLKIPPPRPLPAATPPPPSARF